MNQCNELIPVSFSDAVEFVTYKIINLPNYSVKFDLANLFKYFVNYAELLTALMKILPQNMTFVYKNLVDSEDLLFKSALFMQTMPYLIHALEHIRAQHIMDILIHRLKYKTEINVNDSNMIIAFTLHFNNDLKYKVINYFNLVNELFINSLMENDMISNENCIDLIKHIQLKSNLVDNYIGKELLKLMSYKSDYLIKMYLFPLMDKEIVNLVLST